MLDPGAQAPFRGARAQLHQAAGVAGGDDVWIACGERGELALKSSFDPEGVLNPGRYAGRM